MNICQSCGVIIEVGDWPFCPHGSTVGFTNFRDEIPGGIRVENYGKDPLTFYSHSERRAYMKAHGLEEREKFCPMPGTDKDPQGIPNPKGYMDPQTLKNAEALILRAQRGQTFDAVASGVLKLRESTVVDTQEAIDATLGR